MAASIVDAAAVNPIGINKLLANGLSIFSIKGNPVCSNGFKSLPKRRLFYANEFESSETCVLVNKNLWGKLFLSFESPTRIDKFFKVISVPFFIPESNLLSCELDNFTFKALHRVILYWFYIKSK